MFRQSFDNALLQLDYESGLEPEKVRLARVSGVLAIFLVASFFPLDLWAIPSAVSTVWSIRVVMIFLLAFCLAMTWHQHFSKLYSYITAVFILTMGIGVNAMIYIASPSDFALDAYYGGLLLTTFGIYTLTYVKFRLSIFLSLLLIVNYLFICIYEHNFLHPDKIVVLIVNLYFFLAVTVLGILAQGVRDRYTRENFLLRHSLEQNIEIQVEKKRQASYLAEHDALTGLPNRLNFEKNASAMLERALKIDGEVVFLFIDLNKFKPVNDIHGHEAGDRALKVIAGRLRESLRQQDCIARFGGDEFVACLDIGADISFVKENLIRKIEQPIQVRGTKICLSASIGVAIYPQDATTLNELIAHADADMFENKRYQQNSGEKTR